MLGRLVRAAVMVMLASSAIAQAEDRYAQARLYCLGDVVRLCPDAMLDADAEGHLRTTNPIESVFATVRHRIVRTKGAQSPTTAKPMVFKLIMAAAKTWRRLKGENLLPKVVAGATFKDGTEITKAPEDRAA